jgi:hypothetical protein
LKIHLTGTPFSGRGGRAFLGVRGTDAQSERGPSLLNLTAASPRDGGQSLRGSLGGRVLLGSRPFKILEEHAPASTVRGRLGFHGRRSLAAARAGKGGAARRERFRLLFNSVPAGHAGNSKGYKYLMRIPFL